MPHCHANPIVTSYPSDDVQCVLDCANSACDDPAADKITSHANAISYAGYMAQQQSPCPPGPPCSVADLQAMHSAGGKGATTINWQAILTLLTTLLSSLLSSLFPPAPAPAA